jgi:hypothetical protein
MVQAAWGRRSLRPPAPPEPKQVFFYHTLLHSTGVHLRRHCELVSRRRNAYKSFGELRAHLGGLKVKNAVIDGELVCLDAEVEAFSTNYF